MLICFLCSIAGLVISYRRFLELFSDFHFSEDLNLLAFKFLFSLFTVLYLVAPKNPSMVWIISVVVVFIVVVSPMFLRIYLKRLTSESYLALLDEIILNIRSGKSFRVSFLNAIENRNGILKNFLHEIYYAVTTPNHRITESCNPKIKKIILDLKEIDASPTKSLNQVSVLRRNLKVEYDLIRKIQISSQQVDGQTAVLSALQLILSVLVTVKFGFIENLHLLLISYFLFAIGLVGVVCIKRSFKWKI